MKKILLLLTLVAVVFIALHRQRLYIRDPLAVVYKNGVKQEGFHVYINYSNDVLAQRGTDLQMEEFLIQNWNRIPGFPSELKCLQGIVCLASANHAPMVPLLGASTAEMSAREISYTEETKTSVRITLR